MHSFFHGWTQDPKLNFGCISFNIHYNPYKNPEKSSIAIRYSDPTYQTFGCGYKYVFIANLENGYWISQKTGAAYVSSGKLHPS